MEETRDFIIHMRRRRSRSRRRRRKKLRETYRSKSTRETTPISRVNVGTGRKYRKRNRESCRSNSECTNEDYLLLEGDFRSNVCYGLEIQTKNNKKGLKRRVNGEGEGGETYIVISDINV